MIGRKAIVGLSLLCALLFSAIAVQSASAAAGTNTTAFTCAPGGSGSSDAHCDKEGSGFSHVAIAVKTATKVTTSNFTTGEATSPQVIAGKPFGVTTTITCTKATGTGTLENSEPSAKVHKVTTSWTKTLTGCTASAPAKCTVSGGTIVMKFGSAESQEGLTGPKGEANAMGIELKSEAGKPIATITLEGAECALGGKPFPIEGSLIATNGPGTEEAQNKKFSGTTWVYQPTESMSKTTMGGKPATFSGINTPRMEGGNPITFTTVT